VHHQPRRSNFHPSAAPPPRDRPLPHSISDSSSRLAPGFGSARSLSTTAYYGPGRLGRGAAAVARAGFGLCVIGQRSSELASARARRGGEQFVVVGVRRRSRRREFTCLP
jgi:hypothetical protein